MAQQITIDIVSDVSKLQQGVDQANKQLGGLDASVQKVQKLSAAFVGVGVAAQGFSKVNGFIQSSTTAASDLNEVLNVNGLVFKEDAKTIEAWANTAASSFGQSKRQAIEAAAGFGGLLQNVGFTREESIKTSQQLTVLASDLGSAFNTEPAEALAAIKSGLIGQSEPLRKYNVFLSDTALKQEAMNLGLYDGKGALDQNTKAQATLSLLMKQTTTIQGDFANTADGLANSTRILTAKQEDNAANLGKTFLPIMQQVNNIMIKVVEVFTSLPGPIQTVILVVGLAVAVLGPFLILLNSIKAATAALELATLAKAAADKVATASQWLFNAAMSANPIGLVIVAIAAIIAIIVLLVKNWDTVTKVVGEVWDAIKNFASDAWNVIKSLGSKIGGFVSDLISDFKSIPSQMLSVGRDIAIGIWNGINSVAGWLKTKIFDFFGNLLPGWAKKVLGIASPSKVFAQYGRYIVIGLANGINKNVKIAKKATTDLGRVTSTTFGQPNISLNGGPFQKVVTSTTNKVIPKLNDNTYRVQGGYPNVTINAGAGTDPFALGRAVSSAISKYSRVSNRTAGAYLSL